MRRFFPSATVRNFSLFTNPGIEPAFGTYTFDETVDAVHHFLRLNMTAKNLNALMCANVRPEKSTVLRLTPLPLKTLAMRVAYHQSGESRYTHRPVQHRPPVTARRDGGESPGIWNSYWVPPGTIRWSAQL